MDYLIFKTIHQTAVALSFMGFLARGAGSLAGAGWVGSRLAKTLPHVVDSVLLLSALAMVVTLRLNPAAVPWLAAKIAALLVYIALGMIALRPRLPRRIRAAAGMAAIATFGYIVSVAVTKDAAGFFSWIVP
jgi:uncharacterized membrane protein SirB2